MNQKTLLLNIVAPEGLLRTEENLTAINITLANGSFLGIRPGHAPLIAETNEGKVHFRSGSTRGDYELHAGVLEVRDNVVTILIAGEVSSTPDEITEPAEMNFDRLINTLLANQETSNT
jgi:F0F1-type ATP synthase epsilon subunit